MSTAEAKTSALRRIPIFSCLDPDQARDVADLVTEERVPGGEWLFRQGDEASTFFLVVSGRLAMIDEEHDAFIGEVGAGQSFGELGVISDQVRAAGVRAVRDSRLWAISRASFGDLIDQHPEVRRHLFQTLAQMVRQSRAAEIESRPSIVGVVSAEGPGLATSVARALGEALSAHGSVETVSIDAIPGAKGQDRSELAHRFSHLLDRLEATNDWVLLVSEPAFGHPWRDFALAQCDRVTVVVDAERPDHWSSLAPHQRCDLALVHRRPSLEWWRRFDPVSHHYVGSHPTATALAPLARRLAGRSLGLVMSGGGARGMAHFGAYSELARAGLTFDRFGGTSAGAMAAGAFAMGLSADDALASTREHLARRGVLSDYTVPTVSLIRGRRIERAGQAFYGDRLIEHLPKGFFALSADLISGREVVHRRGSLWRAVRASLSIPGVLTPVVDGERLLVDGGLLNSLPADVMASDTDGQVVCIDLRMPYVPSRRHGFGLLPGQPPALIRRIVHGTDEMLPSIQDILMRSIDLAAASRTLTGIPRIAAVIRPDVSQVSHFDFTRSAPAIEAGRSAARALLAEPGGLADLAE